MHAAILAIYTGLANEVILSYTAGIVVFVIGLVVARKDLARTRDPNKILEQIVVLGNVFFAVPLAVFSAEHLSGDPGIIGIVPKFMPWHVFWAYFVGFALLAASLSMAANIQVRWSGLLLGIMFLIFVSMMDLPGTIKNPHNRLTWTLMLRELSFAGGGWLLASAAMNRKGEGVLFTVGRVLLGITAVFYGMQHFLHPINVPGVPLERLMPAWMPRTVISYLTGAILIVAGACILIAKKTRTAAAYLGSWLVLIVLLVYGPILFIALMTPNPAEKMEGVNYFFDTLLYAGAILALARAIPHEN